MKFLNWLDGKKTAIGAISTLLVAFLMTKGIIDKATADLALGVCSIIVLGGVGHKIKKS